VSAFDVDRERSIGYLLRSTSRLVLGELTDLLVPHGITLGQYLVLRELWENEGATQREVSLRVGIPEPSIVAAVDALGERGLVTRDRSRSDRRKINLRLTERGRELRAELLGYAARIINGATADFTATEVETLRTLLQRLKANLEDHLRVTH
jgi:DNA-binding MarR family transcriptional regulator